MTPIVLPDYCNYVGVFLTLRCNMNCSYCINKYGVTSPADDLSTAGWVEGLSRIQTRQDLPITLSGGEPTLHPGFYDIVDALYIKKKHMDLLTNGTFDLLDFCDRIDPKVFKRDAKYASIRFSYHKDTHPMALATKVWAMRNSGYEVGIWGFSGRGDEMANICTGLNIDFRTKELLSAKEGTYRYPDAIGKDTGKQVWCRTTELLVNPAGYIFRCHADLYANRDFIGHILDKEVKFPVFRECNNYGQCNPCDIKLKFDRFQEGGHCAVEIKGKGVNNICL